MHSLLPIILATLATCSSAGPTTSRTTPPSGCLTVGSGGKYATVQAGVNALSTSSTSSQCLFLYPGTYTEQVLIPALKGPLVVYGSTTDTSSYTSNTATITYHADIVSAGSDDASGTVRNKASNTKFYNVNIANTFVGDQAIALSAYGNQQGYYGCQLTGWQDTLLAQTGTQVYAKTLVVGKTDFIFGQHAPAWFDGVDIRVTGASGYCTASGRNSSSETAYYVFNKCTIAAEAGQNVSAGSFYLGRPWGLYARVAFQNTQMSNVINAAGWTQWNAGDPRTANAIFQEYGNTGPGASGTRKYETALSAPIAIGTILGSGYASWVDTSYLS